VPSCPNPANATQSQATRWQSRWHWQGLIEEPNVAWPEIELSRLLLGQVLVRQFDYRISRNTLPDLCDHLLNRNRRDPALPPPDARERNHNNRGGHLLQVLPSHIDGIARTDLPGPATPWLARIMPAISRGSPTKPGKGLTPLCGAAPTS
jgi:hypothetical protein